MTFSFHVPSAWEPSISTRAEAKRRLNAAYKEAREEFFASRERLARSRGFDKPSRSRAEDRHLRWLVRYQVSGESFTDIARDLTPEDPEASRKTVASGVKQGSKLIGLRLRESTEVPSAHPDRRPTPGTPGKHVFALWLPANAGF